MNELLSLLDQVLVNKTLIQGVISKVRRKPEVAFSKVSVKPVLVRNQYMVQFAYHYPDKVTHRNLLPTQALDELLALLQESFRQAVLFTTNADYQVLISKKGRAKILKKPPTKTQVDLRHNRRKNYIIPNGKPCPFLIRLGVMNKDGRVYSKKYDKFRQINRFLEMVDDVVDEIKASGSLNIIDFGCGKSYLTFALYHYFTYVLGREVSIVGLDLKKDVVDFCNQVAKDLNYDRLRFVHGDIRGFQTGHEVEMVVTLHACDTATDDALAQAVRWNAAVIMSVPCCQHELFEKIDNPILEPMLKHGIIKERLVSLVTDSLRANVLEIMGYSTQLLEFVSMEHTPKNILIRAIRTQKANQTALEQYRSFKKFWHLERPYIELALGEKLSALLEQ